MSELAHGGISAPRQQDFESLLDHFALAAGRRGRRELQRSIAGVGFQMTFAGDAISARLLPALAGTTRTDEPDFTFLVWDSTSASLPVPRQQWRLEDIGPRGEIGVATRSDLLTSFFIPSGTLSVLDLSRRIGLYWVRDAAELPSWECAAPLRTLLHWALATRGARMMHAAAVATSAGGALLAGRGGSGKSTTAMLCVDQGFRYAGDDYVAVRTEPLVEAHAIYSSAKLSEGSLKWLPFLDSGLQAGDPGEKAVAMLGTAAPDQIAESFPVRALIVPAVMGGASRIRRTSSGDALRALAPTTVLQLPGNGKDAFEQLAVVVRRVPAWRLDLGEDRQRIPELVAQAIEAGG